MNLIKSILVSCLLLAIVSCSSSSSGTEIGQKAPKIETTANSGEVFSLDDIIGKKVIIDFWATWCGPCLKEAPELVSLYDDFGGEIEIVSIALEKKNDGRDEIMAKRLGFTWPYRISESITFVRLNDLALSYGVTEIPSTFLLDEEGKVLLANSNIEEIRTYLEAQGN